MRYLPKQSDFDLLCQTNITLHFKAEVLNSNGIVINHLNGLIDGGSFNIDAESDIRRTASLSLVPTDDQSIKIAEDSMLWLNKDVHIYIGIENLRTREVEWYSQGYFVFMDANSSYDATTNQLNLNCSDWCAKLDGSKNGTMGQLIISIPAYEEDGSGNVIQYNTIKEAMITVLRQMAGITEDKIMVDEIGEYKAQEQYNPNWEAYRIEHPLWNTIPYDLEFSCGDTKLSIITTMRDLYPNYEFFFDVDNVAVCQMIPSCEYDPICVQNKDLQDLLISEDVSINMAEVRNVCEIWGQVFETDWYTETCTYASNCYSLTVPNYTVGNDSSYVNGDVISFLCSNNSSGTRYIKVNSLTQIVLYDENTDAPYIEPLEAGTCYTVKIRRNYVNGAYVTKAYMQGTFQVHAMSVLSNGKCEENYTLPSGRVVKKYSKEYFQEIYACENVNIKIIPDSPFVVEKLGELLFVGSGGDYDNITSNSLCLARCDYELYIHARLTDNITLETVIMPFLDVNIKASYQRSDSNQESQYIIKKISHDYSRGTSMIEMMKFYELYE